MPNSTPTPKHKMNVAKVGIRSFLFDLHIGLTTSYSIMKITAQIIIAASDALGIYAKYGVRNPKANKTNTPEMIKTNNHKITTH